MIELREVTNYYGKTPALEDVSCVIEDGAVYGLTGHNGAGKTTLLKVLAGIYRPERGQALADGEPIYENPAVKHRLFIMGEELFFRPQATLGTMRWFYKGYYPRWNDNTYVKLLDLLGLPDGEKIDSFSKGMQRQAGLLLALSTAADFMLLDEAFDGLDLAKRRLLERLLQKYVREKGATVIITSHNLRELEGFVNIVGMIRDRHLRISLPVEEMRRHYHACAFVWRNPDTALLRKIGVRNISLSDCGCTCLAEGNIGRLKETLAALGAEDINMRPMTLEEVFLTEEAPDIDAINDLF